MFIEVFILVTGIKAWNEIGNCIDPSKAQSPIQLEPPFSHIELDVRFQFSKTNDVYIKHTGHELTMVGQFGFVIHNGKIFNAYEVKFKSPSEHSLGVQNQFFPLELQIFFLSSNQLRMGISVLFALNKEGMSDQFLQQLGFGRNVIRDLKAGESFQVPEQINLNELVSEQNNYLVYQGSDTYPPCNQMVWLVSFDLFQLSSNQATDFPEDIIYQVRETQIMKRPIFTNFDPALFTLIGQEQKKGLQKNIPMMSKDFRVQYAEDIIIKDQFTILGDTTLLDSFIYCTQFSAGKVIRTDDYFVVKVKEVPQESTLVGQPQKTKETLKSKKPIEVQTPQTNLNETQQEPIQIIEQILPVSDETEEIFDEISPEEKLNLDIISQQNQQIPLQEVEEEVLQEQNQELYLNQDHWPPLCRYGKQQSPILLKSQELIKTNMQYPIVDYQNIPQELFLTNDGWRLRLVSDKKGFGFLNWEGRSWLATEVLFHHPSEHALEETEFRMDMELQILHRSTEQEILILVLFLHNIKEEKNLFLNNIGIKSDVKYEPIQQGELITLGGRGIKLSQLINGPIEKFITYTGSLTTPPCIENVHYVIQRNRIPVGASQVNNFISLLGKDTNIRRLQNLNHRIIYEN